MATVDLPDFDDLINLAKEIGDIKIELEIDKNRFELLLAEITEITSSDEQYFINGKAPSMAYTEANYHKLGYDEISKQRLNEVKERIARNTGLLKQKQLMMDIYRDMIDVWRTQSANERNATFEGI